MTGSTSGNGKKVVAVILGLTVLAVLVAAGGIYAYSAYQESRTIAVGDCIEEFTATEAPGYSGRRNRAAAEPAEPQKVDCSDPSAVQVVLGIRPADDHSRSCLDVDGVDAEALVIEPELRILCLGPVGVDPSLSVNTISEGECVAVEGEDARRAGCAEPDAMRVLTVLEGVSTVPNIFDGEMAPCVEAGFDNAEILYTWGLRGEASSRLRFDRGICLEPAESAR